MLRICLRHALPLLLLVTALFGLPGCVAYGPTGYAYYPAPVMVVGGWHGRGGGGWGGGGGRYYR